MHNKLLSSGVKRPIKRNEDSSNLSNCSSYNTVISTQSQADPPAISSQELLRELKTTIKRDNIEKQNSGKCNIKSSF